MNEKTVNEFTDEEATEANAVQALVQSLAPFVCKADIGVSREDFLNSVIARMMKELGL